jgi:hypothetical protein
MAIVYICMQMLAGLAAGGLAYAYVYRLHYHNRVC